ncbi:MAG: ABC transporter ATP-binding protein [Pseudomonadota bacterium]
MSTQSHCHSAKADQFIRCYKLQRHYRRGQETVKVLDDVSLEIAQGDFVALMGPSGSGKSTLLNLLSGLDQPDAGQVDVEGVNLGALSRATLTDWRAANVGYIFQFYNLIGILSARQNVELPLLLTTMSKSERRQRVAAALELVGLADRERHRPGELSGGQQQRVAIARAIVTDPRLLVCDEPTGDLDRTSADEVLSILKLLNQEKGKTIVMVTHDPQAAEYAGQCWQMDKGTLRRAEQVLA